MNVDIDFLIKTTDKLLTRFKGSGDLELGVVLWCALELSKKEKESEVSDDTETAD